MSRHSFAAPSRQQQAKQHLGNRKPQEPAQQHQSTQRTLPGNAHHGRAAGACNDEPYSSESRGDDGASFQRMHKR